MVTDLKSITDVIGDGLHGTPEYDNNGQFFFINGNNLNETIEIKSDTKRVNEEEYNKYKKPLNSNTILLSINGTLGNFARYNNEPVILGKSACYINIKQGYNVDYISWFLKSKVKTDFERNATGTTIKNISLKQIRDFQIYLPDDVVQEKIAKTLNSIQGKIDVNNKINRNLEDQAQAIFKEWFINNGEKDTWEKGTFSDLIITTLGGDWGKAEESGNYTEQVYCMRGADIPEVKSGNKGKMPIRFILPKNLEAKRLMAGDVVVEISGGSPTQSTGRIASISQSLLDRYEEEMVCTNFCRALKPKEGFSMFVYYYWQYMYDRNVFFSYENGTTGIKNLDIKGFLSNEEIVLPPIELIKEFDEFCHSVFDEIFKNGLATEKLSETRDVLLPRLMSGELDVSELDI